LNPEINLSGSPVCSSDLLTYSVLFSASPGIPSGSLGVLSSAGGNSWELKEIPAGTDVTITLKSGVCEKSVTIQAPNCACEPVEAIITGDTSICLSDSIILSASGGNSYLWNTGDTTSSIVVSPAADSVFSVVVFNGINCSDTAQVFIRVNPLPDLALSDDTTIIYGQSTPVFALTDLEFTWLPSTGLSCSSCQDPIASPLETTTYCVNVINRFGCKASDCLKITVDTLCEDLFVPNVFAPVGGGHLANDCFKLYGTDCVVSVKLSVYSRWGEKVFESNDILACWDGTFEGKILNSGVFVYQLEAELFTGETLSKGGNVTLLR
jgi:gliding motility-associated-like protein